jgi:uncharacterized protein (TIGR02996 family)
VDTEAALLSAIAADPADPLPWRALADWLDEHGQADRAELARLTLRLRLERGHAEHASWQERVRALLAGGVKPCVPVLTNSAGVRFALVPPGTFRAGSPDYEEYQDTDDFYKREGEMPREVELTRACWLGVVPVTQGQFAKVMGRNPSAFSAGGEMADRVRGMDTSCFPVEMVSWHDAVAFCRTLSELPAEKKAGRSYRLPTDAEWEYACRAGTTTTYQFGDVLTHAQAHFARDRWERTGWNGRTHKVGARKPNAFGLYDMHGTVWEWCADWFDPSSDYGAHPRRDPQGPATGTDRVLRGGAWDVDADGCRSAYRNANVPEAANDRNGFRVVCNAPPFPPRRAVG